MVTGGALESVIQQRRVLITGGYGYIGGRAAHQLVKMGHKVFIGSRSKNNPPDWCPKAKVIQLRWTDSESILNACRNIDVVIHAAGMNASDCVTDPLGALEINGVGTARLVQSATSIGVSKIIYLSTAHVYGSPLTGIIDEQTCPKNLHPYATSHLAGEKALLTGVQNSKNTTGTILRLSNAVGRPMTINTNCWMLFVNDLCRQAVTTGTLFLKSSVNIQRDFVPMGNLVSILGYLVNNKSNEVGGAILNVGSGSTMTLLDMAEKIQLRCRKVLGFSPSIQHSDDVNVIDKRIDFNYKVDKIKRLDISMNCDLDAEIDKLLLFCMNSFNMKNRG